MAVLVITSFEDKSSIARNIILLVPELVGFDESLKLEHRYSEVAKFLCNINFLFFDNIIIKSAVRITERNSELISYVKNAVVI